MKILITGSTGFIGRPLCAKLLQDGHELTLLLRRAESLPADWTLPSRTLIWDPTEKECPYPLDEYDAVVNLMGESIAGKSWTSERKTSLRLSRITATQRLSQALSKRDKPLDCLVNASAIGYYPYDQKQAMTEESPAGDHFLAKLCVEWEEAALQIPAQRHVILRLGVVLGPNGGALERLQPIFAAGLGGRVGTGEQIVSWIHRDDILRMIAIALKDHAWQGIYNAVAPKPISNRQLTHALARSVRRPAPFPVPAFALRLAFGEMSEVLLKGQNVIPKHLQQQGFTWQYPDIDKALEDAAALPKLEAQQFIPRPLAEVFAFFGNPHNLEKITPASLNFKIKAISDTPMRAGTTIEYHLRLHGVPFHWKTLIKEWEPGQYFVDTQEKGPYRVWHHTHRFYEVPGGTLMTDEVKYQVPLGWLGDRVASGLVRREVQEIFAHRRRVIAEIFNKNKDIEKATSTV